jgi:flagellar hook-associated protein 1 FlgK
MSFNIAFNSAVSSLLALERQMAIASANISNAGTAGYTAKSANLATRTSGGQATGVDVAGISSAVNKYLFAAIVSNTSKSGQTSTYSSYYNSLQQLFGEVSSGNSGGDIASLMTKLSNALSDLAATPDDVSLKSAVVDAMDQIASTLRSTSAGIQGLRGDADQQIADTVTDINAALDTIDSLNDQIVRAKAMGQPTADLEDQRMTALQTVSGAIGVTYFIDGTGSMKVYTATNQPLVDDSAHHLSHQPASSLSTGVTYGGGGIDGIYLGGEDITGQIKSGSLKALIDMRDTDLPNAQAELDNLAATLSATLNGIANQGSAVPPPGSLTGTVAVDAADSVSPAPGTVLRVEMTDADGKVTGYQDIDLSDATSVQDILDKLNAVGGITATITDGHLVISAEGDGGVAIATLSGSLGGATGGKDVSSYFGLNDLMTGGGSAATIAVRGDLLQGFGSLPVGAIGTDTPPVIGDPAVGASDGSIIDRLSEAFDGKQGFAAAGWLGAGQMSLTQYASNLVSDIAGRASSATDKAGVQDSALAALQDDFSSQSGVNVDEQTAIMASLQNAYAASAQIISTVQSMFQSLLTAVQSG